MIFISRFPPRGPVAGLFLPPGPALRTDAGDGPGACFDKSGTTAESSYSIITIGTMILQTLQALQAREEGRRGDEKGAARLIVVRGSSQFASANVASLTVGNFDGVHLGHRELLRTTVSRARSAEMIAVALTFSPHPIRFFSPGARFSAIPTLEG